jgi:hypothetical protein
MAPVVGLICVGAFFAAAVLAIPICRWKSAAAIIYGACLAISVAGLANALIGLLAGGTAPGVVLPLGLPWLGAHFRIDALPPSSSPSSIWAGPPPPSMASAMAGMSTNRSASCRFSRPFSPA